MHGDYFDKNGFHINDNEFATREEAISYLMSGKDFRKFDREEANEELDFYEQKYTDPNDIIAQFRREGVENIRLFAQMRKIDFFVPLLGITLSGNNYDWVECRIDEDRYNLHEGYKITLVPVEPFNQSFTSDSYYQHDFRSMYEDGCFIRKESDGQRVQFVQEIEEIPGTNAHYVHEGHVVV